MRMREYKPRVDWYLSSSWLAKKRRFCIVNITSAKNRHFKKFLTSFKMYIIEQNVGEISKKDKPMG